MVYNASVIAATQEHNVISSVPVMAGVRTTHVSAILLYQVVKQKLGKQSLLYNCSVLDDLLSSIIQQWDYLSLECNCIN